MAIGETEMVYGLELMTIGFMDPEYTKVQGAVPVREILKSVELPEQIEVVPEIVAVGAGLTVTALLKLATQLLEAVVVKITL